MTLINTWKPNKFKSPYRYYRDTIYPLYCRDTQESGEAKETPEVDEEGFTIRPPSAESILDCVLIKLKKNKTWFKLESLDWQVLWHSTYPILTRERVNVVVLSWAVL